MVSLPDPARSVQEEQTAFLDLRLRVENCSIQALSCRVLSELRAN